MNHRRWICELQFSRSRITASRELQQPETTGHAGPLKLPQGRTRTGRRSARCFRVPLVRLILVAARHRLCRDMVAPRRRGFAIALALLAGTLPGQAWDGGARLLQPSAGLRALAGARARLSGAALWRPPPSWTNLTSLPRSTSSSTSASCSWTTSRSGAWTTTGPARWNCSTRAAATANFAIAKYFQPVLVLGVPPARLRLVYVWR